MGVIYADIIISNTTKLHLQHVTTRSLVDTGSLFLFIPEHIAIQLELQEFEKREITNADGSKQLCAYVGPLRIDFANRMCLTGALVLGEQPLLGAVPIEEMDLAIHPAQLKLIVNPANPNIPGAIAM